MGPPGRDVAPAPASGAEDDKGRPMVVLGVPGSPIPPAPPASLRDRLPREMTKALPWVSPRPLLPEVDPFQEELEQEHEKLMRGVLRDERPAHARLFVGEGMRVPSSFGSKVPLSSPTAKHWTGGRPSDVIVAVPQKSGTTWMLHICHQLRVAGRPPDFDDQYDVINWLETGYALLGQDADAEQPHGLPRIFKSHLPFAALPSGTRKIYVYRDICDALLSYFWFVVPIQGLTGKVTFAVHLEEFLGPPGKRAFLESSLENLATWWEHRNDPDVLFLFYDDLLQQHRDCVERVANFLQLGTAAVDTVVAQTTHAAMASTRGPSGTDPFAEHNSAEFLALMLGLRPEDRHPLVSKVRKGGGKSGSARAVFPAAVLARVESAWEELVRSRLGFRDLAEMQAARKRELRGAAL